MKKNLKLVMIPLAAFLIQGCSALKPISSTPPCQALILEQPYVSKGMIQTLTLPKGKYEATMEDASAFYYAAPGRLIGHDALGNYLLDGGIRMEKKSQTNFSAYYADPQYATTCRWKLADDFRPTFGN